MLRDYIFPNFLTLLIFLFSYFGFDKNENYSAYINKEFNLYSVNSGKIYIQNKEYIQTKLKIVNNFSHETINTTNNKTKPYIDYSNYKNAIVSLYIEGNINVNINDDKKLKRLIFQIDKLKPNEMFFINLITEKPLDIEDLSFYAELTGIKINQNIKKEKIYPYKNYIFFLLLIAIIVLRNKFLKLKKEASNVEELKNKILEKEKELFTLQGKYSEQSLFSVENGNRLEDKIVVKEQEIRELYMKINELEKALIRGGV